MKRIKSYLEKLNFELSLGFSIVFGLILNTVVTVSLISIKSNLLDFLSFLKNQKCWTYGYAGVIVLLIALLLIICGIIRANSRFTW